MKLLKLTHILDLAGLYGKNATKKAIVHVEAVLPLSNPSKQDQEQRINFTEIKTKENDEKS